MEEAIKANLKIDFVGPFKPNTYGNGTFAKGIKPEMYAGFASLIPANSNTRKIEAPKAAPKTASSGQQTDRSR